ncbi:MAG: SIMPL domain-containing protein [Chloroflexota bacterium]|nr:SIMPL domain-containing protein [Chloroflexota bacterium]MDE2941148.1 SIMPL domain-containing protein [Chloroflexota bacterium]MDE3267326.1 SIMPL domain-containing protein [Chloroflexota bacterium]
MRLGSLLLPALAIAALLIAAIACDTGESSLSASELAALTQYNQGIRVTGTGTVSVAPDVATLRMGVETTAETADEAGREAATAMNAIMDVLRTRGIPDSDVQTTQFSIVPEYRDSDPYYMEGESPAGAFMGALESTSREDSGEKDLEDSEALGDLMGILMAVGMMAGEEGGQSPEILADGHPDSLAPIGYRVTNNVVVKVRDLAAVGAVIDEIVQAGGDAARVDGVWFSAEDTTEARSQAREMAMKDAVARADELAAHAGATRGKLMNVSEDSRGGNYYDEYAVLEARGTPISAGELEIKVSVHATFAIE